MPGATRQHAGKTQGPQTANQPAALVANFFGNLRPGKAVFQRSVVCFAAAQQGNLEIADERFVVHAGDVLTFSSQVPHGYSNVGTGLARILWVNSPATF